MIQALKVENYRGIERLEVQGLRRVNLITGRNDCGKTALLEAVFLAGLGSLANAQYLRRLQTPIGDFDNYWRPIFRNGDAERGLTVEMQEDGKPIRFHARKIAESETLAKESASGIEGVSVWKILQKLETSGQVKENLIIGRPDAQVFLPANFGTKAANTAWIFGRPDLNQQDLKLFSDLKQAGRDTVVVELLQKINDQIRNLDLLAPTGKEATLFVRIADGSRMLPFSMMGEGTQRCFEVALALASEGLQVACLDEIENGLHHSTSEKLWRFIATATKSRNAQIFATTHSEECIQTAARIFTELDDDGLCVLRLDRHAHETTAAVYDRSLVQATERMKIEIRG